MAYTSRLNAVPGGFAANSYATLDEADAYYATSEGAAGWATMSGTSSETDESNERKERLLISATRAVDQYSVFRAAPFFARDQQPTLYPRAGQALRNPTRRDPYLCGTVETCSVDSTGATTITTGATRNAILSPDELVGGSVIVTLGTGKGAMRRVTAFDSETGAITVDTPYGDDPLDTSSAVYVLWPVNRALIAAVCEQAWSLYVGDMGGGDRAGGLEDILALGVTNYGAPGLSVGGASPVTGKLCKAAIDILRRSGLLATSVRIASEW